MLNQASRRNRNFGIGTSLSVYSCSVSASIGDGLVTGPVTATVSCYRNNC
jgi:hypothetical protein